jgi:hypothetical protein
MESSFFFLEPFFLSEVDLWLEKANRAWETISQAR